MCYKCLNKKNKEEKELTAKEGMYMYISLGSPFGEMARHFHELNSILLGHKQPRKLKKKCKNELLMISNINSAIFDGYYDGARTRRIKKFVYHKPKNDHN